MKFRPLFCELYVIVLKCYHNNLVVDVVVAALSVFESLQGTNVFDGS